MLAGNAVLDQPDAALGDFLFRLLVIVETARISDRRVDAEICHEALQRNAGQPIELDEKERNQDARQSL